MKGIRETAESLLSGIEGAVGKLPAGASDERLSPQHREDNYLFGPALLDQHTGTFLCRGAGGQDVIDQQNGLPFQGPVTLFPPAQPEGAA